MDRFRAELRDFIDSGFDGMGDALVFGEGVPGARVMLIGEAPGEQETRFGRPFVGKAGKNLDEFLTVAGLDRAQLYVTNVVKLRPTKLSKAGRTVNRPPTRDEIERFLPWLLREISIVAPACIVTLGNVPLMALTDRHTVIGDVHGRLIHRDGRTLYPMYHPASVIYNPSLRPVYVEDIRRFGAWLRGEMPNA
ncbi:MAG: uracil-DNA glycosylase [Clostridia bacterium]|nr:uracil-DNA glycosylase [Clostridia bacterium]